jgi:RHS repeat-associated protein
MLLSIRRGLFIISFTLFPFWVVVAPAAAHSNSDVPLTSVDSTGLAVPGFEEPMFAIGSPSDADTRALKSALDTYTRQSDPLHIDALTQFLEAYPDSPWRVGLLTNLGLIYYHYGAFSKAIDAWEEAWRLGSRATGQHEKAMVDRALGELVRMHARIGHAERVAALLEEAAKRPLGGPATEAIAGAKEGLWMMQNEPGVAYLCGPMALKSILALNNPKSPGISQLEKVRSGKHGVSLAEVDRLAKEVGLPYIMARREGNAPLPLPVVIHWKISHYAAVVGEQDGRYHVIDPTFGNDLWIPKAVLDQESSGYFLIPRDKLGQGWAKVASAEADKIRGMGYTGTNNPNRTTPCDNKNSNTCGSSKGMASYDVHSMVVSLNLQDTPVGYTPPKGPAVNVTLTYNQREAMQPSNFTFFNLGQKWTLNWLSYIQDDPTLAGANVMHYVAGGGAYNYAGYNSSTGAFTPETQQGAVLVRTSASPITYERRLSDGSKEIYKQSDNATFYPRRVFLVQKMDRTGNAVMLNYDAQMRLTSVTDALGQQTIFAYENLANNLLITKVTDPFGRTAQIAYDSNGRLTRITDAIGMTSQFSYDASTFIQAMTTPYGTTQFSYGESGTTRWLNVTDPQGNTERTEYNHNAPGIPFSETIVPAGINTFNAYINARNTFYWDKTAYKLAAGDYTRAEIKHFLHLSTNTNVTDSVLESVKHPLENRVWFNYPDQPWAGGTGGQENVSATARVLDDGSTQLTRKSYNSIGNLTDRIDAAGRETVYEYDSNLIDLLRVKQKNGSGYDTLAAHTYNSQHLPLTDTDAAGQTATFTYNASGQLLSATNAKGETTRYQYDANGYLNSVINANGQTQIRYTYDAVGRVATQTDSEGYVEAFSYDALDRLIRITYPDATYRDFSWDKLDLGNERDRLGRIMTYTHDSVRNLVSITDPISRFIKLAYYENGQLESFTDGNGNTSTWYRDIEHRVTSKRYADGRSVNYAYENTTSRLKSGTDALGQVKRYAYTQDDQLAAISYSNTVHPTPNVTFAYDPAYPRRVSMSDGNGLTQFQYYPAGVLGGTKLKLEDGPYQNDAVQSSYDALGRIVTRTVDTTTETFGFDAIGRMVSDQNPLGTFGYQYLGQTNQTTRTTGGVVDTRYRYESNVHDRHLRMILNLAKGDGAQGALYRTDAENLITRMTEFGRPISHEDEQDRNSDDEAGLVKHFAYRYDGVNRLTDVIAKTGARYDYDLADNLLSAQGPQLGFTASYNDVNQIIAANSASYQYDANGNLLDDGKRQYAWDAENRLLSISDKTVPGKISRFRYDGLSRRLAIIDQANATATPIEKRYLWCGATLCQERDALDNVSKHYYAQGETQGATALYYARNHLGSVMKFYNSQGKIEAANDYDAYGNTLSRATNGINADFRYAGMYYHEASKLYLTLYRAYDPATTRWVSRDPIEEEGGINLYAYVDGNPVSLVDTTGNFGIPSVIGGAIVVGGVAYTGYKIYQWVSNIVNAGTALNNLGTAATNLGNNYGSCVNDPSGAACATLQQNGSNLYEKCAPQAVKSGAQVVNAINGARGTPSIKGDSGMSVSPSAGPIPPK